MSRFKKILAVIILAAFAVTLTGAQEKVEFQGTTPCGRQDHAQRAARRSGWSGPLSGRGAAARAGRALLGSRGGHATPHGRRGSCSGGTSSFASTASGPERDHRPWIRTPQRRRRWLMSVAGRIPGLQAAAGVDGKHIGVIGWSPRRCGGAVPDRRRISALGARKLPGLRLLLPVLSHAPAEAGHAPVASLRGRGHDLPPGRWWSSSGQSWSKGDRKIEMTASEVLRGNVRVRRRRLERGLQRSALRVRPGSSG